MKSLGESPRKLPFILALVAVFLLGGGAGWFYFYSTHHHHGHRTPSFVGQAGSSQAQPTANATSEATSERALVPEIPPLPRLDAGTR